MGIGGKSFQAWGNNSCKGPEAAPCLVCCRNSKEACDGWSKMSKGVRGRRGRQAGSGGRWCWTLWAARRSWAFTQREVGALEGCGQRRRNLTLGAHRRPLVATSGRTGWG